jgi:hypothetical protein
MSIHTANRAANFGKTCGVETLPLEIAEGTPPSTQVSLVTSLAVLCGRALREGTPNLYSLSVARLKGTAVVLHVLSNSQIPFAIVT